MQYELVHGQPMPEEEVTFEKIQFSHLDADGGGYIDYQEFLKHESCKMLASRDKVSIIVHFIKRNDILNENLLPFDHAIDSQQHSQLY